MSESAIRTEIVAILGTVTDIGIVHNRFRFANDWKTFLDMFKTTIGGVDLIRGWMVSEIAPLSEDYTNVKKRTYAINGYLAFNDGQSSELTMAALIDAIAIAFRPNKTMNNAALGHDYIQVLANEPRTFGGTICHYARLTLAVQDYNP